MRVFYMKAFRVAWIVVTVSIMVLAPGGGIVSAQTPPCAIAVGPLTAQQMQAVNEYEILVARANSKHTAVPAMPDAVFVLIGCTSPADQTAMAAANMGMTSTSSSTSRSQGSPPATPTPAPTTASHSTPTSTTFTCPPNGLDKAQLSKINDYEVLVARANSKHTQVPTPPDDVAAFLTCQ
jgi:hypothetical protein